MIKKKKEYTNGELTVVWEASKCIHSEICVKTLPEVYDPKARPWIKPENASTEALKAQIDRCPSGALTYYMKDEEQAETAPAPAQTQIEVVENGPLLVFGSISIKNKDGSIDHNSSRTAFCRCGKSKNKPFCDGTHKKIDFKG